MIDAARVNPAIDGYRWIGQPGSWARSPFFSRNVLPETRNMTSADCLAC